MKNKLILLAGALWVFAGTKITAIAISTYSSLSDLSYVALSVIIFYLFYFKIFASMLNKNIIRIKNLKADETHIWSFFDQKSYTIMAFMMTLGIFLRKIESIPRLFFFTFYLGLGLALFMAGFRYFYICIKKKGKVYA